MQDDIISTSKQDPAVVDIACQSTHSFLSAISPNGGYFGDYSSPIPFVFRGVSSLSHTLVPSILRGVDHGFGGYEFATSDDTFGHWDRLLWEQAILRSFFWLADRNGLLIPEDSQTVRGFMSQLGDTLFVHKVLDGDELWPPDALLSVLGVAQHYGLPTRLLDWTRDALIAAYFAAEGGVRSLYSNNILEDSIVVWALNLGLREVYRLEESLVLVTSSAALNLRLHAQQGLFTLYREHPIDVKKPAYGVPLNEYIADESRFPGTSNSQLFLRFSLPISQASELLRKLYRLGYSGARLFPGFEGIVESLKQMHFSDRVRETKNVFYHRPKNSRVVDSETAKEEPETTG